MGTPPPNIEHCLSTDDWAPLTPLSQMVEQLSIAFEQHHAAGLLVVDGGFLEEIELNYGTDAYQKVVEEVSTLICEVTAEWLGEDDYVLGGELGSNEFFVFLFRPRDDSSLFTQALPTIAHALSKAFEQMRGRLAYPYAVKNLHLPMGFSVALHNPILHGARQLYRLLEQVRREVDLGEQLRARRRRNALLKFVLGGQVAVVYQPIVDLASEQVYGYEALARPPKNIGVSSPDDLFEVGREMGLSIELDRLCRTQGLIGADRIPAGAKLFVNCLPAAIHDPSFRGENLCKLLSDQGLNPSDIVLEISERESIQNFTIFREARDYYSSLGIRIALDDTGAGYSSLRAVMELAPDFIKLDHYLLRSIDTDPPRQELLRALVAVSKKIGSSIIAEGIETQGELEAARHLQIAFGQGFLLGRPGDLP